MEIDKKRLTIAIPIFLLIVIVIAGNLVGKFFGEVQKRKQQQETSKLITSKISQLDIGDTLPNVKYEVIEGDSVWLYEILSKKCVLSIVLPLCDDCIYEAQELKAALKDPSDAKYFIFLSWDNPRTFEEFKNETGLESYFLYDHKKQNFAEYDITTYPFNITLDKNGVVLDMLTGAMWKEDFEEIIDYNRKSELAEN